MAIYDENAYFHSPLGLSAESRRPWLLEQCRRNYLVLAVGNHDPLFDQNVKLAHLLGVKHIPHVTRRMGRLWPRLAMVASNGSKIFRVVGQPILAAAAFQAACSDRGCPGFRRVKFAVRTRQFQERDNL